MTRHLPCVLTIAGTDPSGGAGIQADIKTISALGCYAASVITALVAQNTQGVQAIETVSPDFIQQQLHSVFDDMDIRAIKIGMLHDEKIISAVFDILKKVPTRPIVLDPVMVAKDGSALFSSQMIDAMKSIFPLVKLITPNLYEAEKIWGREIKTLSEMENAAKHLGKTFEVNVLIKGGHLNTPESADVLYSRENGKIDWFSAERIPSHNTHGTGCTLSSAIAAYVAKGLALPAAIQAGKAYLTRAIEAGRSLNIGKGRGPLHHFYFLSEIP